MPTTTIFIAVQCFQCSTMQVKQKKKSSNKWNCVVCNEKQSICKVFFEGFLAKDVRKFVQNFNMSRKFADENNKEALISSLGEGIVDHTTQEENGYQRKRRNDWSEYLDLDNENDPEGGADHQQRGREFEPEIVTELPKEMFKKPKLKNDSAKLKKPEGSKFVSPILSKAHISTPLVTQGEVASTKNQCINKLAYKELFLENYKQMNESQRETTQGASKWSEYLTKDEDDDMFFNERENLPAQQWNKSAMEVQFNDQRVEEDIHPDFI